MNTYVLCLEQEQGDIGKEETEIKTWVSAVKAKNRMLGFSAIGTELKFVLKTETVELTHLKII